MREKIFTITAKDGVHARPATVLVNTASHYSSEITMMFEGRQVNLKSIMSVMLMGIGQDAKVTVKANGPDEEEAMIGVTEIFQSEGLGKVL